MAPRQMKMPTKKDFDNEHEEVFSQRKRPESGRYLLQVDRQTKGSYTTPEAAQAGALVIKKGYPILRRAVYARGECTHTLIEAPGASSCRRSAVSPPSPPSAISGGQAPDYSGGS